MGALVIDNQKYARILARVLPRVITTDEEHERLLAEVEKLMDKSQHRTAEEDAALDLLVRLVKATKTSTILCPIRVLTRCWCI